jgi:hypothetical protein
MTLTSENIPWEGEAPPGSIPSIRRGGSVRVPTEALRAWITREVEAHVAARA